MKNSVTKIVIWSVVAALLIAMLVCAIVVPSVMSIKGGKTAAGPDNFSYKYAGESSYNVGEAEISADGIKNIDIDWISGNVSITVYDGDTVKIDEADRDNKDFKLRYKASNGTLTIKACKSSAFTRLSGDELDKKLTVYIPQNVAQGLKNVKLYGSSAAFEVKGLRAQNITAETVSGALSFYDTECAVKLKAETVAGDISAYNAEASRLIVNTVSGDISVNGSFGEIDGETVSGEMYLASKTVVKDIDVSSVSGRIILSLPETDGFKVSADTVNGAFESKFPVTAQGNSFVYGDGLHDYHVETTSGDILLKK